MPALNKADSLTETTISSPYCGEQITVLLDPQEAGQQYVEDCQVCCKPIVFNLEMGSLSELSVTVHDENDVY